MANVTNLAQRIKGVKLSKGGSVKPDGDGVSKRYNLVVDFDGVMLKSVFDKAMQKVIIDFANNTARPKYDQWKDGHTFRVKFKAPTQVMIDPREAYKNELAAKSPEQRAAELEKLINELESME